VVAQRDGVELAARAFRANPRAWMSRMEKKPLKGNGLVLRLAFARKIRNKIA
jgi:hypothetical protein